MSSEWSPLAAAASALGEAEDDLVGLPSTPGVRELQRRWYALRTVIQGVAIDRQLVLTSAQELRLMETAVSLATEVAATRRAHGM